MEQPPTLACPWCPHEATNGDAFRTHLMVEHRKSELASYVLDTRRRDAAQTNDEDDEPDVERELVAR